MMDLTFMMDPQTSHNQGFAFILVIVVNARFIGGGVKEVNFPGFMREVFRILKPGTGLAQCIEPGSPDCLSENNSLPPDAALSKVNKLSYAQSTSCN
jgi:hypothetical protein